MARSPKEFKDHPLGYDERPVYRAYCTHIVDGDTIDVMVDLGLRKYAYESIRIDKIDTAEIYRPKSEEERASGYEAKAYLSKLILNNQVKIATDKDKQSFNRYVADVYFFDIENKQWISVAEIMKEAGYDWSDKK